MKAKKLFGVALFSVSALVATSCGQGVILGPNGSGSYLQSLRLNLIAGDWGPAINTPLSANSVPSNLAFPMSGSFTNYTASELISLSTPGNPATVRHLVSTPTYYMLTHFCFEVTNIDVASYTKIRIEAVAEGGTGPLASPPDAGNFMMGVWNNSLNTYDANFVYGSYLPIQINFSLSEGTTPSQARFPLNTGTVDCIIVAAMSNGQTNGSPPYSMLGFLQLAVFLDP